MSYFWKYFCETLGFLIDDVVDIFNGIKDVVFPIFLCIMVITGSTAFVTIIIHYLDTETALAAAFYYVTYVFFFQIGVCALYWICTGAKRAKRRMR